MTAAIDFVYFSRENVWYGFDFYIRSFIDFRDAKLVAVEKANQDAERSFSQLKAEKLRQMDELQSMNKKQSDFEARSVIY